MKIIVDAMGGDHAPLEIVKGAVMAGRELNAQIVLTGPTEAILKALEEMGENEIPQGVEIANASQVVEMEDDPTSVVRKKPDSSMMVGLKMLRDGQGDAFVSAGSTGALLSGATLLVKRVRGIRRAAFAPFIPTDEGGMLLLDSGANVECTPEYLLQFAYMGSFYMEKVKKIQNPRVGILNIGTEDSKGGPLQKETYALLEKAAAQGRIHFIGNVEPRDILRGGCDVLVTDGFSGNVLLKSLEGTGLYILGEIKKAFMATFLTKLGALLVKKRLAATKKKLDVSEIGGTALLGISKPVIKAHGSVRAYAMRSAILQAAETVKGRVPEAIRDNVEYMKSEEETPVKNG